MAFSLFITSEKSPSNEGKIREKKGGILGKVYWIYERKY